MVQFPHPHPHATVELGQLNQIFLFFLKCPWNDFGGHSTVAMQETFRW